MALDVFYSGRAALESVRGTDLTPTRIIYFDSCTETQDVATIRPAEHRNSYNAFYAASAGPERNQLQFSGKVSYDDLGWWAALFAKGGVSPTGAGADRTWTYVPTAGSDDLKSATFQLAHSDTIATAPGYKYNFAMMESFNLHFEKNDDGAVTFQANLLAAKAASSITAFTGSLTDRTPTLASSNGTQVYIDSSTIGSTADPKVVSVDWTVSLGPVALYTLDGTTAANAVYRPNFRTWSATIVRQYDAATERAAYVAKTKRLVRVKTLGPSLGSSNYEIRLDLSGVYTSRRSASVDGIVTEELTLEPLYDSTMTGDHGLVIVNSITAAYT